MNQEAAEKAGKLILLIMSIGTITFVIWLITLIDIIKSDFKENNKIIWLLLTILMAPIGIILYLTIGRGQKTSKYQNEMSGLKVTERSNKQEPKPF